MESPTLMSGNFLLTMPLNVKALRNSWKTHWRRFYLQPNANDVTNRVIPKLITKMLPHAPAAPLRNKNAEVNRNNDIDINTQLINFFGNPLNPFRLVEEAEKDRCWHDTHDQ